MSLGNSSINSAEPLSFRSRVEVVCILYHRLRGCHLAVMLQIRIHHFPDQSGERSCTCPTELRLRLATIPDEVGDLRSAVELGGDYGVLAVVETDLLECKLTTLPNGVRFPGRNDKILGLILLEHEPHGL